MHRHMRIACLLLVGSLAAMPRMSLGQGAGFTSEQYAGLEERVKEFCEYLFEVKREGKPLPMGDLALPGAGDGYVYTGGEVIALMAKCDALVPLMQQMMKPVN
jgi:hypothetical protein